MSDAAFEGDLSQRSLADVLGEIYRRSLKGRLSVQLAGVPPLELHVENGLASSPTGDPEAEVRRTGAMGQGRYSLEPGPSPGAQASPMLKLVLAAARAIPALDQVRSALGNLDAPLGLTDLGRNSLSTEASLSAQEGFLLSRVNGVGSLREICQVSPAGEDETLRTILGLTAAGLLQIDATAETPVAATPRRAMRDDPMARLQGFLKKTENPASASPAAAPVKSERRPATRVAEPDRAAAPRKTGGATTAAKEVPAATGTRSVRAMLLERLRASEAQDYYQLLEVETGSSEELIQKSYYSLARRYHPDLFHTADVVDLQPAMELLFARVNQAFYTLKNPEKRQEYDRLLSKGSHDTRKIQQAAAREVGRENFRRGRQLVAKGQYVKALPFLENAVRGDPSEPEYFETLGIVQSLNPRLKEEAEQTLKTACELGPARAAGFLRLGLHYFKTRQTKKAAKALQEALGWDPTDPLTRIALSKVQAGGANAIKDGTWLIRKLLEDPTDD